MPSPRTVFTAAWPQAASMAGPGRRAGGEVMLPWAETNVTAKAAMARIVVFIFSD